MHKTRTSEMFPVQLAVASTVEGVQTCISLDAALELLSGSQYEQQVETIFVIGGGQVYAECMQSPLLSAIHLTQVSRSCFVSDCARAKCKLYILI